MEEHSWLRNDLMCLTFFNVFLVEIGAESWKIETYGVIASIPRGGVPIEGDSGLGGVYSNAISGLGGWIDAVEAFDNDGGSGNGDCPKPGSSLGSIFGKYWTVE